MSGCSIRSGSGRWPIGVGFIRFVVGVVDVEEKVVGLVGVAGEIAIVVEVSLDPVGVFAPVGEDALVGVAVGGGAVEGVAVELELVNLPVLKHFVSRPRKRRALKSKL